MFADVHQQTAGGLGDPSTGRAGGDAGQVYPAVVDFDDEQDVQPRESDRLYGEEDAREHPGSLDAEHQQILQIISAAEARGQTRLTQMNRQVADNLGRIITALESDQPPEVADATS